MMRKTLASMVFAAGCAMIPVLSAQAQTVETQLLMNAPRVDPGDRIDWTANPNNMDSARYERLLRNNPAFRESRMQKECGSIEIAHLRAGCIDSFNLSEDQRSKGLREGLTGDSHGRMNPIDRTFQGPEIYDPHLGR